MLRVNQYKKVCYLTDSEKCQISDFFKNLFDVDNITQICVYLDEGNVVCDIEGFDTPTTSTIGSMIQHDMGVEREITSAERFRAFVDAYNKKHDARRVLVYSTTPDGEMVPEYWTTRADIETGKEV